MLDKTKHIRLCNIHCPDFPSPGVQILKDMLMDTAKVVKVKISMNRLLLKLVQTYGCKPDFSLQ